MPEYITKSDAVFCACKVLDKFGGCTMGAFCPDSGCREVREEFDKLPAADVKPVARGKWALVEKRRKASVYRCSECGNFFTVWPDTLNCGRGDMNYCTNCGADMREVAP